MDTHVGHTNHGEVAQTRTKRTRDLSYKFQRLREKVRTAITSGELTGKLPGERILAKRFSCNAKTLSKALTDLAAEGLLEPLASDAGLMSRHRTGGRRAGAMAASLQSGRSRLGAGEGATEREPQGAGDHGRTFEPSQLYQSIHGCCGHDGYGSGAVPARPGGKRNPRGRARA